MKNQMTKSEAVSPRRIGNLSLSRRVKNTMPTFVNSSTVFQMSQMHVTRINVVSKLKQNPSGIEMAPIASMFLSIGSSQERSSECSTSLIHKNYNLTCS